MAHFISGVSQGMSMIAIPWYFTQQNEMVRFGIVYMLTNVMALFWVPYSGAITDRFSRKKILIVLMSLLGCIIIGIALWGYGMGDLPWYTVALVFVLTFLNYNIHYPTLYAFVQEMSDIKYYGKVTSLIEIQGQFTTILAGAGGALLLAGIPEGGLTILGYSLPFDIAFKPWAIHEIFLLDGLSYFLGALILMLIPFVSGSQLSQVVLPVRTRLQQGIDYLKENKYVSIFGFASYVVFMAVIIEGFFLLAPYVGLHLGQDASIYAAGKMTYALGAILAGFIIRLVFRRFSILDSVIFLTMIAAAIFAIFFFNYNIWLFFALAVLLGLCNAGIRIQRVTYLFTRVPNEIFGRVSSAFNLGNIMARIAFIGLFSIPFFQQAGGIKWTFAILALVCLIGGIILVIHRDQIRLKG